MHKLKKEIDIKDIEKKKEKLEKDYQKTNVQFSKSKGEKVEEQFKSYTVGLSTREEFKRKQDNIYALIQEKEDDQLQKEELEKKRQIQDRKKKYQKSKQILSFAEEDEDEEKNLNNDDADDLLLTLNKKKQENTKDAEENLNEKRENPEKNKIESSTGDYLKKKVMIGKNPNVNTLYLPDMQRDHAQFLKKEMLKQEYLEKKEKLENQQVEIKYSYWDGFKIIKTMRIKQKVTVLDFLENCRKNLLQEYPQLIQLKAIDLIAVARDEILPSKKSFYEMILTNIKNKEGQPIFEFKEKIEKDPLGKDITVSYDDQTVIMIVEKSVTEKAGENPLYFFLKK